MIEEVDLSAWPSDSCRNKTATERLNIVEFYHKILWASQHQGYCDDTNKKSSSRRVQFSPNPPDIYEYEPEYSHGLLLKYFKKKKFQYHRGNEYYPRNIINIDAQDQEIVACCDEAPVQNRRLSKPRSLSEFRPIPNQQFNKEKQPSPEYNAFYDSMRLFSSSSPTNLSMMFIPPVDTEQDNYGGTTIVSPTILSESAAATATSANSDQSSEDNDDDDPPPSYIEYNISNQQDGTRQSKQSPYNTLRKKFMCSLRSSETSLLIRKNSSRLLDLGDVNNNSSSSSISNSHAGQAFIQRTLRKFKSSPRLMIQRRASVATLRKKISFLGA